MAGAEGKFVLLISHLYKQEENLALDNNRKTEIRVDGQNLSITRCYDA